MLHDRRKKVSRGSPSCHLQGQSRNRPESDAGVYGAGKGKSKIRDQPDALRGIFKISLKSKS